MQVRLTNVVGLGLLFVGGRPRPAGGAPPTQMTSLLAVARAVVTPGSVRLSRAAYGRGGGALWDIT